MLKSGSGSIVEHFVELQNALLHLIDAETLRAIADVAARVPNETSR